MNNSDLKEEIIKLKQSDKLIIVEGKKDKAALEKLGVGNIFTLSKKPLFHVIEEIAGAGKGVVILTDLDRHGKELYGRLNSGLQYHGVKVDNKFREFLFKKTKLRQIEGLYNHIRRNST